MSYRALSLCLPTLLVGLFAARDAACGTVEEERDHYPEGLTSRTPAERLVSDLRNAVRVGDARAVSRMIVYPLTVRDGCSLTVLRTPRDAVAKYKLLMSHGVGEALGKLPSSDVDSYGGQVSIVDGQIELVAVSRNHMKIGGEWVLRWRSEAIKAGERCALLTCSTKSDHYRIEAYRGLYSLYVQSRRHGGRRTVFTNGWETVEGSGGCAHRLWIFRNTNERLIVSEPSCGDVAPYPVASVQPLPMVPMAEDRDHETYEMPGDSKPCRLKASSRR